MILQIKNITNYDQSINLHTGQSMTITSGLSIKVDTGTDPRLAKYYASLTSYGFEVLLLQAQGNEANIFQDALDRLSEINAAAKRAQSMQDKTVYAHENASYHIEVPHQTPAPNPVTIGDIFNNEPINKVQSVVVESSVPKVQYSQSGASQASSQKVELVEILDTGVNIVEDHTPILPEDYPDNPNAVAALKKIEMQEKQLLAELDPDQAKYDELMKYSAAKLKEILMTEFNESTSLRSASKIARHIIEVAKDTESDLDAIIKKYSD